MTTLKSFQDEIEQIHTREVSKQRTYAHGLATAAADKEKAKAKPTAAPKKAEVKPADKLGDKPTAAEQHSAKVEVGASAPDLAVPDADERALSATEVDAEIQALLLSQTPADSERVRDVIAALLTRNKGERLVHLGAQPPNAQLFTPTSKEDPPYDDKWIGARRTSDELHAMHTTLGKVVEEIGGKVSVVAENWGDNPRLVLLLRLPSPNISLTPEVRIAVVGNVDAGKSSFLGVLTRGALDDGRGRARVGLFRHKHEIETGRTSSVGMEILGFAPSGEPILPNTSTSADPDVIRREKLAWETISAQAAKIVSFIDLAGHERYLKTTLYGLTSGAPSCVVLMVGANAGLIGMSKEHLAIALALNVPVVVCITKIDMTPPNVQAETVRQVVKILRSPGCRYQPVFVRSKEVAVEISQVYAKERICPIFLVSNVTGEGLDYVRTFMNLLPSSEGDTDKYVADQPLEYSVTEVWSVPYAGTVVSGIMNSGNVKTGDQIMLGPDLNGGFLTTMVKSMQRKRTTVTTAEAGQSVTLALKRVRKAAVRKGMVIVHKAEAPPKATRRFEGQVLILYHNTTLQKNYQAMLHCGAIRQTVRIVEIDHPQEVLRTGDRATVQFEFISNPEFIKPGWKLLFREGKTKGLGVITQLF